MKKFDLSFGHPPFLGLVRIQSIQNCQSGQDSETGHDEDLLEDRLTHSVSTNKRYTYIHSLTCLLSTSWYQVQPIQVEPLAVVWPLAMEPSSSQSMWPSSTLGTTCGRWVLGLAQWSLSYFTDQAGDQVQGYNHKWGEWRWAEKIEDAWKEYLLHFVEM